MTSSWTVSARMSTTSPIAAKRFPRAASSGGIAGSGGASFAWRRRHFRLRCLKSSRHCVARVVASWPHSAAATRSSSGSERGLSWTTLARRLVTISRPLRSTMSPRGAWIGMTRARFWLASAR